MGGSSRILIFFEDVGKRDAKTARVHRKDVGISPRDCLENHFVP